VAETDALEQEGAFAHFAARHEPAEQTVCVGCGLGVILGQAAGDEQQQAPRRVRPAALRPVALRQPVFEHRGDPALVTHAPALGLPDLGRLLEQVAHRLPADHRVALQ